MVSLRPALEEEAASLTDLCLRSKAFWGYDDAFMKACSDELTITAEDFLRSAICVAVDGETIVGMAQFGIAGENASLHKLFVEPSCIGTGAGREMFAWSLARATQHGARHLWIEADPNAAGFYRKMGAVEDGFTLSESIPGRVLPRMRLDLR